VTHFSAPSVERAATAASPCSARSLISWEDKRAERNNRTCFREEGCTMTASDDSQSPAGDDDGSDDIAEDPGEELEAMIEQADRPFASESFGTTAEEQHEGEPLDQRLGEERADKPPLDRQLAIEDFDAPDDEKEMVGQASLEHDHFVAPEEAAMTVRDRAPGAVDHPDHDVEPYDESSEGA
jgi:hypothetical protein